MRQSAINYALFEGKSQMRAQYKVAVVGPGGIGLCAIREALRLPEMQLVGVLAFSPQKNGKDVGELAGIGNTGVKVTTDLDTLLRQDIDCVLYCGRDFGDWRSDAHILRMLEAGVDVITMLPYHYLKVRGPEIEARFRKAAQAGGATLHGTGITPGFFNERLAVLATSMTNAVTHIKFQEFFNAEPLAGALETLQMFGFGSPKEQAERNDAIGIMAESYLRQPMMFVADQLGIKVDRVEREARPQAAPVAIKTPAMTIEKGTVGTVSYAWTAYSNGRPFYTTEVYWYLGEVMRPATAVGNDFWTIEIEGRPSLRITIASMASFKDSIYIKPEEPSPPGYIMTAVSMLQAVPAVVAAKPGLLLPSLPQFYWKPDMRS
jgi:2,4-diaminopentanoate dehydrogenase